MIRSSEENNMKVGIMTWFQYHNYGTSLQVTGTYKILKKYGYEPAVIDYKESGNPIFKHRKGVIKSSFDIIKKRLQDHPYHRYEEKGREERFDDFLRENLKFTRSVQLMSELESLNNEFDAFICGSDQIWAPSVFNTHYYLDFVFEDNKKIAYAPSVGLPQIDDENVRHLIKKYASKFSSISTREEQGSRIISEIIGRDVETVIDPTLLLTSKEWNELASNNYENSAPYLLVYMLGKNEKYWKTIEKIAKQLKLEIKIIPVFFGDLDRSGCIKEPVGPADFLSLIKNASYVCTDSFHGLAFSVNYGKKFCVFERFKNNDKLNQNSRIYNALNLFQLNSRLVNSNLNTVIFDDINYSRVYEILNSEREKSIKYLLDSLEKTEASKRKCANNLFEKSQMCCGCGTCKEACPVDAISIKLDEFGFYRAILDESKCISCGKCIKVCPYLNANYEKHISEAELYSYIDEDTKVLKESSSGGLAFRIANTGMEKGHCIVGCEFDPSQHRAKHIVLTPDEMNKLTLFQGSKYIQSDFASITNELISPERRLLIFGTPCQIAGIRNLLYDRDNVVFVDLICHGVPSYNLYLKYMEYLKGVGLNTDTYLETKFRYKPRGWRERYIYNTDSHTEYCKSQNVDPYFLMFEHGFCYSKSCYECPWRDKSCADIRLGDYWHEKYSENTTGVSMAAVFTEKGRMWIQELMSTAAYLKKEPVSDYAECQQTKNNKMPVFWEDLQNDLVSEKSLDDIVNEYIVPFDKRKKLTRVLKKMRRK